MNRDARRQSGGTSKHYDAHLRQPAALARERATGLDGEAETDLLSLAELVDEADVTVRTVRYYIAEGLLPPPIGAGPGSAYGQGHLDRLHLIQRLKEAYLPLKEIRRRLAGLDDKAVRAILAEGGDAEAATSLRETAADASLAEARDYLAMMESRARYRTEPMALLMPAAPAPEHEPLAEGGDLVLEASLDWGQPDVAAALAPERKQFVSEAPARDPLPERQDSLWRRIPLGDEAELVISDRVYARHRERIDWLVRWARKVFA